LSDGKERFLCFRHSPFRRLPHDTFPGGAPNEQSANGADRCCYVPGQRIVMRKTGLRRGATGHVSISERGKHGEGRRTMCRVAARRLSSEFSMNLGGGFSG
jgi:hypothetical protein